MPNPLGADPQALFRLAHQFRVDADELSSHIDRVDARVRSAWWRGSDADRFRDEWQDKAIRLRRVVTNLRTTAAECETQARRQQSTSAS